MNNRTLRAILLVMVFFPTHFAFATSRNFVGNFDDGSKFELRQVDVSIDKGDRTYYILTFKKFVYPTYYVIYGGVPYIQFHKQGQDQIVVNLQSIPAWEAKQVESKLDHLKLILGHSYNSAGAQSSELWLHIKTRERIY